MPDLQRPVIDVGLVVRDFDRALAFYRDKLGFTPTRRLGMDAETSQRAGLGGASFEIQYMQVGDANLKLVRFESAPPAGPAGPGGAAGYRYVTLWVKDLAKTCAEWKAKGVEFLSEPIRRTPELQMVFLKDPDGNLIELLGP
ncbi:MAG: hypothetical protein A3J27_09135 [Candidatus Tectomicrobia bacterium RIFCSPLOWO2_12_FULL_69_37]|nr:MAG: hypothetical protein A3J27_09135 [Candidatus Tectomicrobia bacterium RIFCSPLOWO2_12_FULL_69_37]OGL63279.1 MAG: hypothetical protein A3I72_11870 [Candidatus Tectomicrobia bacterium RIFCSPLOWO2_02_FULL_70_19]